MPERENDEKVEEDGKISILVPKEEPDRKEDDARDPAPGAFDGKLVPGDAPKKKKKDDDGKGEDTLSDEDKELKEALELAVARIAELGEEGVTLNALATLRDHIRTSTSTMTAVPKPLKFLSPLYPTLVAAYDKVANKTAAVAVQLADVMSIVSMARADLKPGTSLNYKLAGTHGDLDTWGHEFIRHLAGEIGAEHSRRTQADPPEDTATLMVLVDQIVPFNITHSAEAEAVDLLMEVQELPKLLSSAVDTDSTNRICQ